MLGLIRQLAKLITLAKNLPSLLSFLPRLLNPAELIALIVSALSQPQIQRATQQNEQLVSDLQENREARIDQVNSDDTLSENQKSIRIQNINERYDSRQSAVTSPEHIQMTQDNIQEDYRSKVEPTVQTATAPLGLLVGIPTGLQYITNLLAGNIDFSVRTEKSILNVDSGLGGINITSAEDAEADFNSQLNEFDQLPSGNFPIGDKPRTEITTLKLSSLEPAPTLTYRENGDINPVKLNIDEDFFDPIDNKIGISKEDPNYRISIIEFIDVPFAVHDNFILKLDGKQLIVAISYELDKLPASEFNGRIKVFVSANKTIGGFGTAFVTVPSDNTFTIPVELANRPVSE